MVIDGKVPKCNCGRVGDLESLVSLTGSEQNILFNSVMADGKPTPEERRSMPKNLRERHEATEES